MPLYSPVSDAPWTDSPVRSAATEDRTSRASQDSAKQRREEEKKAYKELRTTYLSKVERCTEEHQWREFCSTVAALCVDLKSLVDKHRSQGRPPRGNRTRQWRTRRGDRQNNTRQDGRRNRQSNRERNERRNNQQNRGQNGRGDTTRGDTHEDESEHGHRRTGDREPGSRISGRERWVQNAKRLQAQYRRNAKQCIQKLLQQEETRERCTIPMEVIQQHFNESGGAGHRDHKPEWIEDPEREGKDVLDVSFTAGEVVHQLRRLPARSAPGPDGLTYQNWKGLDPERESSSPEYLRYADSLRESLKNGSRAPLFWSLRTEVTSETWPTGTQFASKIHCTRFMPL